MGRDVGEADEVPDGSLGVDPGGGCATSLKMTTGGSSSGCGRGGRGYRRDAGGVGSRTWQQLGQGNDGGSGGGATEGRGGRDGRDRARGFKARRARRRVGMRPDARTRRRRSCRGAARDGGSSEGDGIDERREERGKVRRRGGGLDSPASRRWRREATPWKTAEEGDRARDAPGGGGWTRGRDGDRAGLARVRRDWWGRLGLGPRETGPPWWGGEGPEAWLGPTLTLMKNKKQNREKKERKRG